MEMSLKLACQFCYKVWSAKLSEMAREKFDSSLMAYVWKF